MSDAIEFASAVLMHFTLSLADGTLVDSSQDGEPLSFALGDGTLDAGLEALLLGLHAGDRAQFNLAPGQAFGDPDPGNVHPMPRGEFPPEMALAEGAVVEFTTPGGEAVAGTVLAIGDDSITMDFSHPLAGRQLSFQVEIIAVTAPKPPG